MSSRVEEQNAQAAAEAERLAQRADKQAREAKTTEAGREAFAKLVKNNQQDGKTAKGTKEKSEAEARQGEAQGQKSASSSQQADRAARMARGGVMQHARVMEQARSFSQVLGHQQSSTAQADGQRVEARDQGAHKERVERDDKDRDVGRAEVKQEGDREQSRIEARAEARQGGPIDPDGRNRGGGGQGGQGRGDEGASALAALQKGAAPPAAALQGAAGARQIPPEILEKLVSAVYLAVTEKGLKEFQIELKDGPLKGGFLKLSADKGQVTLSFLGLEGDQKRLVEASKGELMRRLEKKGLRLHKLSVG
ncbi:MAG: hypothetical protein IT382_23165 [Deltaproteobacteria bacterium]|nr:hypothetical protein [Deltaproteobacteria bacterium]